MTERGGDHGFLSDCISAALVDRDGTVDWWCLPRFDGPSVFGGICWRRTPAPVAAPRRPGDHGRAYLDDTLVLRTVHETASPARRRHRRPGPRARGARARDRRPEPPDPRPPGRGPRRERRAADRAGAAPRVRLVVPHLRQLEPPACGLEAVGGPVRLICTGPVEWQLAGNVAAATFRVAAGDVLVLRLAAETAFPEPDGTDADREQRAARAADVDDTVTAWRSWAEDHVDYDGTHPDLVRRAAVVLQGLTYAPSGAVVAAATTSLPETNGADYTWDYRFAWVRDLSLTARALWFATCPDEPRRLFRWLTTAMGHLDGQRVQIVYGVGGERDLTERVLTQLPGYRGARPVRAGNEAWRQRQFDVMGEVLDAAQLVLGEDGEPFPPDVADLLAGLAEQARRSWREPDAGMWEVRRRRSTTPRRRSCAGWPSIGR